MRSRLWSVRLVVIVVVSLGLLSACGGGDETTEERDASDATSPSTTVDPEVTTAVPSTTTVPPTTAAPTTTTEVIRQELELIGLGEYEVGVATVVIASETERPLTVDVWFPIDEASGLDAQEYTFLPGIFYRSPNAVEASLADISVDGPFPLIAYSHGSGGQRFIHSNYTETLASHGHIVVSADHTGNTLIEALTGAGGDLVGSAEARPGDVDTLLDAALGTEGPTELSAALSPVLSEDPVVITGHSLGGFASYASIAGITTANIDFEGDDRIGAAITLAPFATEEVLSDDLLARVDVPQLIIVGSDDKTTPIDPNVERLWALTAGSPTYRVELAKAEHLTFTDLCDYVTFLPELGTVPDFVTTELARRSEAGCAPDDMPSARSQELTNTFAIRFLDEFYEGEPFIDLASERLPDDVVFAAR